MNETVTKATANWNQHCPGFDETGQNSFSKINTDRNTAVSTVDRTNLNCNFRNFRNDSQCAKNQATLKKMKFSNAMKNDCEKKNEIESKDTGALISKVTFKERAADHGECDIISFHSKTSSVREVTDGQLQQASVTRKVSGPPDSDVGSHGLQCHICSRMFSNTYLRDYHVKHHGVMRFVCPKSECGNMFHDRRGLKNQIRIRKHHGDLIESEILTKSGLCTKPLSLGSPKQQFCFKSKRVTSRRGHKDNKITFTCPVKNCGNIFQSCSDYHSHFLRMHYSFLPTQRQNKEFIHNSGTGGHHPTQRQIEHLKHISGTGGHHPTQGQIEHFIQYSATTGNHSTQRQSENFIQYSGTGGHHSFSSQQNIQNIILQNHSVFPTNLMTLEAVAGSFETTTRQSTMTLSSQGDSLKTFKVPTGALKKSSYLFIFPSQVISSKTPLQNSLRCLSRGIASVDPPETVSLQSTEAENKDIAVIHTNLEQKQLASRSRVGTSKCKC